MKVYLDIDGCLTDFTTAASAIHGVENPYNDCQNWGKYDMHTLLGMSWEEFIAPMGFEFWATMPFRDVADLILAELQDFDVCLVTKPLETRGCHDGKAELLRRHLPDYPYMMGPNKAVLGSGLLIDDCEAEIRAWPLRSGFLLPAPWNYKCAQDDILELQKWLVNYEGS